MTFVYSCNILSIFPGYKICNMFIIYRILRHTLAPVMIFSIFSLPYWWNNEVVLFWNFFDSYWVGVFFIFSCCTPLKIFYSIICFYSVFMVHLWLIFWIRYECLCHYSMDLTRFSLYLYCSIAPHIDCCIHRFFYSISFCIYYSSIFDSICNIFWLCKYLFHWFFLLYKQYNRIKIIATYLRIFLLSSFDSCSGKISTIIWRTSQQIIFSRSLSLASFCLGDNLVYRHAIGLLLFWIRFDLGDFCHHDRKCLFCHRCKIGVIKNNCNNRFSVADRRSRTFGSYSQPISRIPSRSSLWYLLHSIDYFTNAW